MTTIAYHRGVLASDGRVTMVEAGESSYIVSDKCQKIWRLRDGRLFAAAKGCEDGLRLLALMQKSKGGWPTVKCEDINAFVVDLKGKIHFYEGNLWQDHDKPWIAIGSGSRVGALPALMAGADAITAVKIGIACDPFSGGRIHSLTLRKPRVNKRVTRSKRTGK